METIVKEKQITFKTLEQKIFEHVCMLARKLTCTILETMDHELSENRDRKLYRDKGKRTTTIKTVYGEVTYKRRVYETRTEDGRKAYVYLLDEKMQMDRIGLISTNLAEKITMAVTEAPYRVTAETISSTSGQGISHGGVWNLVQKLGERISREEEQAVKQMKAGVPGGEKALPVLFEEMDGVWLGMQDRGHKKKKKQEMKVFTMYEGWDEGKEEEGRGSLVGKVMLAGMEKSQEFHEKREALIEKKYAADEIGQRVLNGDGGNWIREDYDPETIYQLDRYHICQEILRKISDRKAQGDIRALLEEGKVEEMLEYIKIYADSVASDEEKDKRSRKALELYQYLKNNEEGLLPYRERGIRIPEPPEGVIYKNMGIQESQNCTVITLRMKHRRMRWSEGGADHLGKILYRKENRELSETIGRYTDSLPLTVPEEEILKVLSAAKAPKKEGKGSVYAELVHRHMPIEDACRTEGRKALLAALIG